MAKPAMPKLKHIKFRVADKTQGIAGLALALEPPKGYRLKGMLRDRKGNVDITYERLPTAAKGS
jgi:hypothetical protein